LVDEIKKANLYKNDQSDAEESSFEDHSPGLIKLPDEIDSETDVTSAIRSFKQGRG
jgi:hypothetical protein